MLGHTFLLNAVENEIGEGKKLDFIKQVLSSSSFKITDYTCVIIEQDEYDYGQVSGGSSITKTIEPYNLCVIVKSENKNKLTDAIRREIQSTLDEQVAKILNVILEAEKTANGICNVQFGKAAPWDLAIDGAQAMEVIIPVTITVIN